MIDKFISYLKNEKNYSTHTLEAYANDLIQFEKFTLLNHHTFDIPKINHHDIRAWIVSLSEQSHSAKSINRKISSLSSWFKYLRKIGEGPSINPMNKITSPKIPKRLPKFVREDSTKSLFGLNDLFNDQFTSIRDRLILLLFYTTGIRRNELQQLKDSDIHSNHLKVLGKGNKERIIPISTNLLTQIKIYTSARDAEFKKSTFDSLIVTDKGKPCYPKFIYNTVKKYLSVISTIEKPSPHVLRHTFATHLASHGADINAIKTLLGHSSLAATQIYTHNTVKRLQTTYAKTHPRANQES